MSCITRQHVGKYTYLYESISFRDKDGKPRNKKTKIGKIDPETGRTIYIQEYLDKMSAMGTPVDISPAPIKNRDKDWQPIVRKTLDTARSYGTFHLLTELSKQIGLLPLIQDAFPDNGNEIFTLVCFLIESEEPVMYCREWTSQTVTLPVRDMASQRISDLFSAMTMEQRNLFYQSWLKQCREDNYVALDITSISSYSQLMQRCEWGYNRDNENLPQINMCLLFGETSRIPMYQTTYNGSLADVSTLRTTIAEVTALTPNCDLRVVMDKGFFSTKNIDTMLDPEEPIHFLISVPFTSSFAKKQVESERKDIDQIDNTILTKEGAIRGIHKLRSWGKNGIKLHTFVYFNPVKELKERNDLYRYITELKQEAHKNPENKRLAQDFRRYLIIRKSSSSTTGHTVNIREDEVSKKLATCGWMVLISDTMDDAQEALNVYRTKDVVEKSFCRLKNTLDLNRLRVHNDERMENKLFVSFIALILISAVHHRMQEHGLYKYLSLHEMLLKLRKLRMATVNGIDIMQPVSKEQRDILKAFGIKEPVG